MPQGKKIPFNAPQQLREQHAASLERAESEKRAEREREKAERPSLDFDPCGR